MADAARCANKYAKKKEKDKEEEKKEKDKEKEEENMTILAIYHGAPLRTRSDYLLNNILIY